MISSAELKTVVSWQPLNADAKFVWADLWEMAGGVPATIRVPLYRLGEQNGHTEDGFTQRMLRHLSFVGLIDVLQRERLEWIVEVHNPIEVKRSIKIRLANFHTANAATPAIRKELMKRCGIIEN